MCLVWKAITKLEGNYNWEMFFLILKVGPRQLLGEPSWNTYSRLFEAVRGFLAPEGHFAKNLLKHRTWLSLSYFGSFNIEPDDFLMGPRTRYRWLTMCSEGSEDNNDNDGFQENRGFTRLYEGLKSWSSVNAARKSWSIVNVARKSWSSIM